MLLAADMFFLSAIGVIVVLALLIRRQFAGY
jgi:hypothetical protein